LAGGLLIHVLASKPPRERAIVLGWVRENQCIISDRSGL